MVFPIAGGNESKGYEISNSLRFNDDDSPNLTVAQSTPTDGSRWTWSGWVKRGNLSNGSNAETFASSYNGTNTDRIQFTEDDELHVEFKDGNTTKLELHTSQLFRDVAAWYHIVVAFDSNLSQSNRVKIYINGTQVTSFSTSTELTTSGYTTKGFNANSKNFVHGAYEGSSLLNYYDGYLTEVNFVDGAAKAQTDFGEFNDNGVWIPIKYTGTYGNNGFFLQFKQTGTSANSSGIGADTSGNDNHFAVTNLAATDITEDTCTNNFCTVNVLDKSSDFALSEGNLKVTSSGSNYGNSRSTFALSSGKWYWEARISNTGTAHTVGITTQAASLSTYLGNHANDYAYARDGTKWNNNSSSSYGASYADGDIIGIALDLDGGTLIFYKNGSSQGTAFSSLSGEFFPAFGDIAGADDIIWIANFGNPPFAISSGNTDGKYGNFEYAPPSGYYALCTKRLAEFG